ncbi:methionine ABC transporter substrate-binding protein, partial [Phocaeicola vulgatus]
MQRRQLIKGLAAGAIVSTLLPAFAAEPVTLKVGASPLVTGDILE